MCSCHHLFVSIKSSTTLSLFDDVNGSIAVELGPFHHISHSTIIKESIAKGLVRDTEYAVRVIITTFHLVVKSDSHAFGELLFLDLLHWDGLYIILIYTSNQQKI